MSAVVRHPGFCFLFQQFNVEKAIIQLESSNTDGVCITSLQINNEILLLGKNKSKSEFWIDGDQNVCTDTVVAASEISIRNGDVYSSPCKSKNLIF